MAFYQPAKLTSCGSNPSCASQTMNFNFSQRIVGMVFVGLGITGFALSFNGNNHSQFLSLAMGITLVAYGLLYYNSWKN